MATSITERILGNNKILTDNYYSANISLIKSIIVVNSVESSLYNEYINYKHKSHQIDLSDKSTWRYYKHLNAEYHDVDLDITVTSLDNGETIILDRLTISLHSKTKAELLKFGLFYKSLVDRFPQQELFIRSCITTTIYTDIQDIIQLEDYTIVSYNSDLIEENENNVIPILQSRIFNYKNIRLIPYYNISDNLFITSQYCAFYLFLLTTLLSIRLANAKTVNANSYHILNYLASHHGLDIHYSYLTKKQALFLYRNMLYLDNSVGKHQTFKLLIDKLFTDRNMSVVNYKYTQNNSLASDSSVNYNFKQEVLNSKNMIYDTRDFSLSDLNSKIERLAVGNRRVLETTAPKIDTAFKNSLYNTLITKDIECILVDNTDNVRYKIVPTIIDYWAYLLKNNKVNFLLTVTDPVSNKELKLSTKDAFKLFIITLCKSNSCNIIEFPIYRIKHVFNTSLPNTDDLLNLLPKKKYWYKDTINDIKSNIPVYSYIYTSLQFEQYVYNVYKLNIGLWLLLTNLSDKYDNGQFELLIDRLNTSEGYDCTDETVPNFLTRIGLENVQTYSKTVLEQLTYDILNKVFDNKLNFVNKYKYIQKALIDVFKSFTSYSTQVIDNYYTDNPTLAGINSTRYSVSQEINVKEFFYNIYPITVDMDYIFSIDLAIASSTSINARNKYISNSNLDMGVSHTVTGKSVNKVIISFNSNIVNNLGENNWVVNQSSDSDLSFLVANL